jgi:hypothetical protein
MTEFTAHYERKFSVARQATYELVKTHDNVPVDGPPATQADVEDLAF